MNRHIISDLEKEIEKLHKRDDQLIKETVKERLHEIRHENSRSSYASYTSIKRKS